MTEYISVDFFKDRILILKDNIRQIYPLKKSDYCEKLENESIEKRSDRMPLHHAEQLKIGSKYYYSLRNISYEYKSIDLFQDEAKLEIKDIDNNATIIEVSDVYALDIFFNNFLENPQKSVAYIKLRKKQPRITFLRNTIKKINYVLSDFDGALYILREDAIDEHYVPSEISINLLKKYWGENASFRKIKVYKNPNISKEIAEISQGKIVDTIIREYNNSNTKDAEVRDLFLTAPTGAGKSLLFQLPSFYVSHKGDVTIVVSPLIALMKDQVKTIQSERRFSKVAYINSEINLLDRERIIQSCQSGEIDIIYMSPELLLSYDITHFIGDRHLGLLVIDEAHLITTWGRDFRVDYWFLGNHITKMRKYNNLKFPMVAVTATAIYGGSEDMVFDSVDSLVMQNPYIFIGQVKRNYISFIINNYQKFDSNYKKKKLSQTVEFIKSVNKLGVKTLVYTPYVKQIGKIEKECLEENVSKYYGGLDSYDKELSFRKFKSGESNIMVSTKAFGMGIDISDIQIVYHHAPSGTLTDYVQEIGRVARKSDIQGYAVLNYSKKDKGFSNQLYGMSLINTFEIKEVLKKIYNTFLTNKSRNLLLSVSDFGYIFESSNNLDQQVLSTLMMIEKDYLYKYRFNVLIARPKKLFVLVYAKVDILGFKTLSQHFPYAINKVSEKDNKVIIQINLDKIWERKFNDRSFPMLKRSFYKGKLFHDMGVNTIPQLKMIIERKVDYKQAYAELNDLFDSLSNIFVQLKRSGFFTKDKLYTALYKEIRNESKSRQLTNFILSEFTGMSMLNGKTEINSFLQKRAYMDEDGYEYRVFSTRYLQVFAGMLKKFNKIFADTDAKVVDRFITNNDAYTVDYIRLGYFIELLDIGVFEIKGGDKPMVFIRINDPKRIEYDSKNKYYENSLLTQTYNRHETSNKIFDYFFLHKFTNDERWNFIEDYFLGDDLDTLFNNYKSGNENKVDIINYLQNNIKKVEHSTEKIKTYTSDLDTFQPKPNKFYYLDNILTLTIGNKTKTMKVSEWLKNDPVNFSKAKHKFNFNMDRSVYEILCSRLRKEYPKYYKKIFGLKIEIDFKGYVNPIKAIVPYKNQPIEFYKWWCKHNDDIVLTTKEKLELFNTIYIKKPEILLAKHKKMLRVK